MGLTFSSGSTIKVRHRDEVSPAICKAMDYDGPFLVDFIVEPEENVYPMVPPGKSLSEIIELPKPKRVPKVKPKILARS